MNQPVLSQFAVEPDAGLCLPDLTIDPVTGLNYRTGASVPFIEEMMTATSIWSRASGCETFLTESGDPEDPDLVRAEIYSQQFSSELTRGEMDPADPDLIREVMNANSLMAALSTTMTKTQSESPDPDLMRQ